MSEFRGLPHKGNVTILPIALNRKNGLFAGHDAVAQHWYVIASLTETCKRNGIVPHACLCGVLSHCWREQETHINELLPWNYAKIV